MIAGVLFLLSGCGPGPSVPGSATLGVALNSVADRIETAITTAGNAARGLVIQAGTEAYIATQNAKAAYADSLDKSMDKLDSAATHTLQQLETIANDLESNSDDKIATISSRAQQVTNTLPFANTTPQITSFSPRFYAWTVTPSQAEIAISGNFMFAHQDNFKPSLDIGGKRYDTAENTTQSLKFLATPVFATAPMNRIIPIKMTVSIPYEEKSLLVFTKRKVGTFDILCGVLPTKPGAITLSKKNINQSTERQHVKTQTWQQHSSNDDDKGHQYEGPVVPAGWHVVDSTIQFVDEWHEGDLNDQWSYSLVRANPTVVYSVTTIHHRIGTSGKVNFYFEYDIEHPVSNEEWKPESVDLAWGQSRAFPSEPGGWKVAFDSFDGRHQEYAAPAQDRFLQVRVEGQNVILAVPAARDVKY